MVELSVESVATIVGLMLGGSGLVGLLNWITSAQKGKVDESTATVASMNETNQTLLSTLAFLRSEIDTLTENDARQDKRIREQEIEILALRRNRDEDRAWIRWAVPHIDAVVPSHLRLLPPAWIRETDV